MAAVAAMCVAPVLGCGGGAGAGQYDSGLQGLALTSIDPGTILPGSTIVLGGRSFVDASWGKTTLHVRGSLATTAGQSRNVDAELPAKFVDFQHLQIDVTPAVFAALGGVAGEISAKAQVEVQSSVDGTLHASNAVDLNLAVRKTMTPTVTKIQDSGVLFVNDWVEVDGHGFLLGGNEGQTVATVKGCFVPDGKTACTDVGSQDIPLEPMSPFDRTHGRFAFAPKIAGIEPGQFMGTVTIRNEQSDGTTKSSQSMPVGYQLTTPEIFSIKPTSASLGQYVFVSGGGFVGGQNGDTLLELKGEFQITGATTSTPVDLVLVPDFVEGRLVRYVLSEDDDLGKTVDLRHQTGTFTGTVTPTVEFSGARVTGTGVKTTLSIAPVKQVVYVKFDTSFVESLRKFGLRAVDSAVRDRVFAVMRRAYATINVELRMDPPDDFAEYAELDVSGPDPNGLGLLGYDNTPGKDVNNMRLYDRIGGVNATTQQDGYPGYGGVFIESLFAFSKEDHGMIPSAAFDDIFDPFRPDHGGQPVHAADLAAGVPTRNSGAGCPASDRKDQISCAIWVLGSLIGTTAAHELGHSLGLANPYGQGFHDPGDRPNRLMDAGQFRPFDERAQLFGKGPAVFCTSEYQYLRKILPTDQPSTTFPRPPCD